MIGTTISHYHILDKLGGGGMGVVYKAEDTKLKRIVALKFLPPTFSSDRDAKQRFIHEAQASSSLQHNNICKIHEINETEDNQLFICMEYYEGESLKTKIESGKLKIGNAIDISIQIAKGLEKAHENGIIHRDIKPANIFITNDGVVKILDFGLAKVAGQTQLTQLGTTVGTVNYMSPEQVSGTKVDRRTDIWSLGLIMYEMFTGKNPYIADFEQAVIYLVLNEEPKSVRELNNEISPELDKIVHKCLSKDIDERYQTVDDLLVDFKSFSKEYDISYDDSIPKLLKRFWRKKIVRRIATFATSILFLIILWQILWPKVVEPKEIIFINFENQSGDPQYEYLSFAIPNLMITSLEQTQKFQVISWERIRGILKQLGKDSVNYIDSELGFEICAFEGVPNLVLGSYTKIGNVFSTDLKILDTKSKEIVQTAQSRGEGDQSIFDQIDNLTKKVAVEYGGINEDSFVQSFKTVSEITTYDLEAYKYYSLGLEMWQRMLMPEALEYFKKAAEIDSTFAMAYLGMVFANAYGLENWNVAFEQLELAKKYRDRLSYKDQIMLDVNYDWLKGNNPVKGINKLRKGIKLYPKNANFLYLLAMSYFRNGEKDSSLLYFDKLFSLNPKDRAYNYMGYLYLSLGEYQNAIAAFNKLIEAFPNENNPYDSMGDAYLYSNQFEKSIEMFTRTHQLLSSHPQGLYGIAENMIKMGKYKETREYLNKEVYLNEKYSGRRDFHLNRLTAITYLAEDNIESAVNELEFIVDSQIERKEGEEWTTYLEISEILTHYGELKEAENRLILAKDLLEEMELEQDVKNILFGQYSWFSALFNINKGNLKEAKKNAEEFKKAELEYFEFEMNKTDHLILFGLIAFTEGNYSEALNYLEQANQINPMTDYYTGLVLLKRGETKKSIDKLNEAVNYYGYVSNSNQIMRNKAEKQLAQLTSER